MFSEFVLKFHALSTTAWALIGAIGATVQTSAAVGATSFTANHYRRPGDFRAASITEIYPFDNGHRFLLQAYLT
jgi:hypothetical protein